MKPFILLLITLTLNSVSLANNPLNQRLIRAVMQNNPQEMKKSIALGADINTKNSAGSPLLHIASFMHGDMSLIKELSKQKNIDLKALDAENKNFLEVFKNSQSKKNYENLYEFLKKTHPETLKELEASFNPKKEAFKLEKIKIGDSNSDIIRTFSGGPTSEIRKIIKQPDFDPNLKNSNKQSLLHLLASRGMISAVDAILHHPDINMLVRNPQEETFLEIFYRRNSAKHTNMLLSFEKNHPKKYKEMMKVLETDKPTFFQKIQKTLNKFELNQLNQNQEIINSFTEGSLSQIEQTMKTDFDPNLTNSNGQTLSHILVTRRSLTNLKILLSHKDIDVIVRNSENETFLETFYKKYTLSSYIAFIDYFEKLFPKNYKKIMDFLATHNPELFEITPKELNQFRFMKSINEPIEKIKEAANKPGVNMNQQDEKGDTFLHMLAERGLIDKIELLLDHPGINASITNKAGHTCLTFLELARPELYLELQQRLTVKKANKRASAKTVKPKQVKGKK